MRNLLFLLGIILCSKLVAQSYYEHSMAGIFAPAYPEIIKKLEKAQEMNSGRREIGLSNFDMKIFHIDDYTNEGESLYGYLIQGTQQKSSRLSLIVGGIHGNEYNALVSEFPVLFSSSSRLGLQKYIEVGGSVMIIPIFNVQGYKAHSRRNALMQDLNRSFIKPLKSEVKEVRRFSESFDFYMKENQLKLDWVIDYHCCARGGIYLNDISEQDLESIYIFSDLTNSPVGTIQKILPDYYELPQGSFIEYLYKEYGATALAYEAAPYQESAALHTEALDSVFSHLSRLSH